MLSHSEGALIGTLAAGENVDALISLAGAGRSIDKIIVEQIAKQSQELSENARTAFDEIKENGQTTNYSQYLESIFRPSVQPYIASWMKYDPAEEIAKIEIPVLIINGTFDLQVDVTDAEILKEAKPEAELLILENMNHIFRNIEGENLENTKAYNEPQRPLHPELVPELVEFIRSIE
ncbi:alpha/beta hydrolase [Antarcticibacterium sp. 1MA-6-2]|uniref:alpha/beta hydrolase n=1 Tax=Antarcticibacterium sp. 1MA-6-2 TaxID=2908210 RepID=UPI001F21BCA9|nr:alpha/beta hydrolase [Antarcticibacterium sp. 1MA-6-2]UJH92409.1 alpha/beta hydrolase [Antarcticibacterium sp. 1MA-6-2]